MSESTSGATLAERENLALACLHQHHLLTIDQLHQLVMPGAHRRSVHKLTARLHARGLVASVSRRQGARRHDHVWYLTPDGVEVVQSVPGTAPARRKPITPLIAAGQLQRHTLAVNKAGLAFVQAARERGDDCGPLAWQHEVTHRNGPLRSDVVISDAVLRYQPHPDHGFAVAYRFLELDRATTPVEELAAKLEAYARLARYVPQGAGRPAWQERYLALPGVLVVLAAATPRRLTTRRGNLVALCRRVPELTTDPAVSVWICRLDELTEHGPYGPIFTRLATPNEPSDWLGERSTT